MLKKADAVAYFKNQRKLARALGIGESAVSQWGEFVPPLPASRLHLLSQGNLKYDPATYADWYSKKLKARSNTTHNTP